MVKILFNPFNMILSKPEKCYLRKYPANTYLAKYKEEYTLSPKIGNFLNSNIFYFLSVHYYGFFFTSSVFSVLHHRYQTYKFTKELANARKHKDDPAFCEKQSKKILSPLDQSVRRFQKTLREVDKAFREKLQALRQKNENRKRVDTESNLLNEKHDCLVPNIDTLDKNWISQARQKKFKLEDDHPFIRDALNHVELSDLQLEILNVKNDFFGPYKEGSFLQQRMQKLVVARFEAANLFNRKCSLDEYKTELLETHLEGKVYFHRMMMNQNKVEAIFRGIRLVPFIGYYLAAYWYNDRVEDENRDFIFFGWKKDQEPDSKTYLELYNQTLQKIDRYVEEPSSPSSRDTDYQLKMHSFQSPVKFFHGIVDWVSGEE